MSSNIYDKLLSTKKGVAIYAHQQQTDTNKPKIVLIHGIMASHKMFYPLINVMHNDYNIWSIDIPGFGKSPPIPTPTISEQASRIHNSIHSVVGKCHLLGMSLGGLIGLKIAILHSKNYITLIEQGAPIDSKYVTAISRPDIQILAKLTQLTTAKERIEYIIHNPKTTHVIIKVLQLISYYHREIYTILSSDMVTKFINQVNIDTVMYLWQYIIKFSIIKQLHKIKIPVLAIGSRNDTTVDYSHVYELKKRIPKCKYIIHPTASHHLVINKPLDMKKYIDDFILQ